MEAFHSTCILRWVWLLCGCTRGSFGELKILLHLLWSSDLTFKYPIELLPFPSGYLIKTFSSLRESKMLGEVIPHFSPTTLRKKKNLLLSRDVDCASWQDVAPYSAFTLPISAMPGWISTCTLTHKGLTCHSSPDSVVTSWLLQTQLFTQFSGLPQYFLHVLATAFTNLVIYKFVHLFFPQSLCSSKRGTTIICPVQGLTHSEYTVKDCEWENE